MQPGTDSECLPSTHPTLILCRQELTLITFYQNRFIKKTNTNNIDTGSVKYYLICETSVPVFYMNRFFIWTDIDRDIEQIQSIDSFKVDSTKIIFWSLDLSLCLLFSPFPSRSFSSITHPPCLHRHSLNSKCQQFTSPLLVCTEREHAL